MPSQNTLVALALAALSAGGSAAAQTAGDADARRLALGQAQEARAANDHQRALEFAQRAGAISMTPSVRQFIAQESNAVGRLGEALRAATLCENEALANHAINSRDAIIASCHALIAALRPRVGYVVLHAEGPPPGLQIRVAGQPVNLILLDADFAVTPGDIAIEASAPGGSFASQVPVAVGAHVRVDVQLHPAETPVAATPTIISEPTPARPADNATAPQPLPHESRSTGIGRPLALASLGVGAVAVVGSVATLAYFFFGVVAHCSTDGTCATDQEAATATALSTPLQAAGYGMLIGGGVLAVLGAIGVVVTGHPHDDTSPGSRARRVHVSPFVAGAFGRAMGAEF